MVRRPSRRARRWPANPLSVARLGEVVEQAEEAEAECRDERRPADDQRVLVDPHADEPGLDGAEGQHGQAHDDPGADGHVEAAVVPTGEQGGGERVPQREPEDERDDCAGGEAGRDAHRSVSVGSASAAPGLVPGGRVLDGRRSGRPRATPARRGRGGARRAARR